MKGIGWIPLIALAAGVRAESLQQRHLEGTKILLEDFSLPRHKWRTIQSPVMNGKSSSSLSIDNGVARFSGYCDLVSVPFLQDPGYVKLVTGGFLQMRLERFPDVSSCEGLSMVVKNNAPDYQGYRISFGKVVVPGSHHANGYKAGPLLDLPTDDFEEVVIPFHQFSNKWDEVTGNITVTCDEDPQYCPNQKWLSDLRTIGIWGEGYEGHVDLEIKSISAVGCSEPTPVFISNSLVPSIDEAPRGLAVLLVCLIVVVGVLAVSQKKSNQRVKYEEIATEAVIHLQV